MTDGANDQPATQAGAQEPKSADQIRAEIEDTREQLGDTVEALAEKTDVKARAHDQIDAVKESLSENLGAARDTVAQRADTFIAKAREATPESAAAGAQQVGATVQDRPLPFAAAGAFAAGFVLGWLVGRR